MSKRKVRMGIARTLLFLVLAGGIFFALLTRITDLSRVWSIVRSLSPLQALALASLASLNLATYWPVQMAALPGLGVARAAMVNQSSTSVALTLPGGGAVAVGLTYSMLTSWGFSASSIALSVIVTGVWNLAAKVALAVLALALLAGPDDERAGLLGSAVVASTALAALFVAVLAAIRSEATAQRLGRTAGRAASWWRGLLGRPAVRGWDRGAASLRTQMIGLLRLRWPVLSIATLFSHVAVFAVMLPSVRFVGIGAERVGIGEVFAVFAFVRLGSSFPILPGNVGIAELGYIGGLVVSGGGRAESVAAVLVFRALTFYLQIPIGGFTYLAWLRRARPALRGEPAPDVGARPKEAADAPSEAAG